MTKTIGIKLKPALYLEIIVSGEKILLHDLTSIISERGAKENRKFLGKKTIDLVFSSQNTLKSNKEQLERLTSLTSSYGEATTPFMSRNREYKNIYRIGFDPDKYEIHTIY